VGTCISDGRRLTVPEAAGAAVATPAALGDIVMAGLQPPLPPHGCRRHTVRQTTAPKRLIRGMRIVDGDAGRRIRTAAGFAKNRPFAMDLAASSNCRPRPVTRSVRRHVLHHRSGIAKHHAEPGMVPALHAASYPSLLAFDGPVYGHIERNSTGGRCSLRSRTS
jgi:hypothetical protein